MSKNILITGGAGFIGSNFARHIYNKYPDYKILVLDALTYAGSIDNLPVDINKNNNERLSFWYGDVKDPVLVDALVSKSDMVVHFAAETHVTRSIYDNYFFFETDVMGTQIIASSVVKHRDTVERFVHISTSEVYGTAQAELMSEDHPLIPRSPYAAAKLGGDRLVYSFWATYDIPAVIVRPFNNYGPFQHLEKAVPRFITNCLVNEKLRVHGDGSAQRDFIFVEDTCAAIDAILHADIKKVKGEIFNLASGESRSIGSVAKDVVRLMNADDSLISYIGDRPGQVFRHTGDASKILGELNWKPAVQWEDGLERTIKWYVDNQDWWRKQLWMRTVPVITGTGTTELH